MKPKSHYCEDRTVRIRTMYVESGSLNEIVPSKGYYIEYYANLLPFQH